MKLSFKTIKGKARLINPLKGFTLDEIPYELRFDPLTGETGRVFDFPFTPDMPDLAGTVQRSREIFCPFCPETLEKSTPLFPEDLIPEGRIRVGEATLIPNLVPIDTYAGVSIFSREHYIPIENMTPETMHDPFAAALSFIKRVADQDPLVNFFSINWNYMPPAGSSMVHPHLQPNCGEVPTNELRAQLEACNRYSAESGNTFWHDYIKTERATGERYIGEIDSTFWIMSFVPLGFLPDVRCIFGDHSSLAQIGEAELRPFLIGLSKVLKYFSQHKLFSFNVSILSVRENQHFRINARICPRLFPRAIGNNDMAYLQVLHKEPFTVRRPESVCEEVKKTFTGS
jgi:galactose-1-phosphate uridylyltransferase